MEDQEQKQHKENEDEEYKQYVKILCFGDSLTEGLGGLRRRPYAIELEKCINLQFEHEQKRSIVHQMGMSGECTDHMIPRLASILEQASESKNVYQVVCILAGTNDFASDDSAEVIFDRLKALYSQVLVHGNSNNTILVTITIPQSERGVPEFVRRRVAINTMIKEYSTLDFEDGRQVVNVDLESMLPYYDEDGIKDETHWYDMVHMMPAGYDIFGQLVFDSIKDRLRSLYGELPNKDILETSTVHPPPPPPSLAGVPYAPPHRRRREAGQGEAT